MQVNFLNILYIICPLLCSKDHLSRVDNDLRRGSFSRNVVIIGWRSVAIVMVALLNADGHTHAIFIMIEQRRLTANEHTTIIQISSRMCACVLAQQIVIKGNLCVSTHFAQNSILSAASVHTIKEGRRASNWPRSVVVADLLLLLYGGCFSTIIIILMTLILKQSLTVIDFQLTLPLTLCFSRCSPLRVFANPSKTGRFATLCSHYN